MARCPDCGCGMEGGFCSNCHEEVFIDCQYADLGMDTPPSIAQKACEHINNEERQKTAKSIRVKEESERRREYADAYGEEPR